jgi:DNA-binding LacI/PurR family transcriptional regulator
MANMKEIARLAGVSLGTVSNVLSGLPSVREPLRRRVLEAVQSLGYQPSQLARGLRRDKTNIIGMILSDVSNPFFPAVVKGAEDTAFKNGYRLFLCNSDNDFSKEETYLRELQTYLPAGLIIMTSNINGPTTLADAYRMAGTAVVYVDRLPPHWSGDTVTSMNEGGGYEATKHLISVGHRQLAMITGSASRTNSEDRANGFRRALKEAMIPISPEYIQEGNFEKESGYARTKTLLRLNPRPTAIFAGNDLMAFGALNAIRDAGLRCPEDVSVIGFDNLEMAEVVTPALSSVDQSGYQLGAVAAQIIADRIHGDNVSKTAVVLPTSLAHRLSVAPPPGTRDLPSSQSLPERPRPKKNTSALSYK